MGERLVKSMLGLLIILITYNVVKFALTRIIFVLGFSIQSLFYIGFMVVVGNLALSLIKNK